MITLKLIIIESETGIGIELKSEEGVAAKPTASEKLFARQMAETISNFLNNAPKVVANKQN